VLTVDEQKRKLELVVDTARKAWAKAILRRRAAIMTQTPRQTFALWRLYYLLKIPLCLGVQIITIVATSQR
jgi:hypothetical protein